MAVNKKFVVKNGLVAPNAEITGVLTADSIVSGNTSIDTLVDTAYSNAVSYADILANTTYANAVSYTDTAVANLVDTAPDALNTLNELAAALGDDPDFANTVVGQVTTAYTNAVSYTDSSISALGLGSLSTQNSNSVNIDGGNIDGTAIGASSASSGAFTTLTASDDVNFDSGTLFVDASANRVGIGTTSLNATLDIKPANNAEVLDIRCRNVNDFAYIRFRSNDGVEGIGNISVQRTGVNSGILGLSGADAVRVFSGGSEAMRIDSSGNVLVGTTSIASGLSSFAQLEASHSTAGGIIINTQTAGASNYSRLMFSIGNSNGNEGLIRYNTSDYHMSFWTNAGERMRIDSSGNVGIGTTAPSAALDVRDAGTDAVINLQQDSSNFACAIDIKAVNANGSRYNRITSGALDGTNDWAIGRVSNNVNNNFGIWTANTERMRITSSGNVGIGTTAPASRLHVNGSGTIQNSTFRVLNNALTSGMTIYPPGISGIWPESTGFALASDGSSSPIGFIQGATERMRISSNGNVLIGQTIASNDSGGVYLVPTGAIGSSLLDPTGGNQNLLLNRQNSDGTLVLFRQANTTEGSISVSGTTVSYNGGHLSRWSQLPDNAKDESIVKGTVMTNLDEMAEWVHEDGTIEDNEQLNRMKVSDIEGDTNVAGVFVNWDDDDDMNIAMTGDMVIRIAQGVTVQRGDLLMSAGDGTAKPQGDDIVKSKTIAKVTSTHVSHTYDDGSYLVPCVLMAC